MIFRKMINYNFSFVTLVRLVLGTYTSLIVIIRSYLYCVAFLRIEYKFKIIMLYKNHLILYMRAHATQDSNRHILYNMSSSSTDEHNIAYYYHLQDMQPRVFRAQFQYIEI